MPRRVALVSGLLLLVAAVTRAAGSDDEVRVVFDRFVAAQNAHDLAAVGDLLLDSPKFLWITRGAAIWGREAALTRFDALYKGTWAPGAGWRRAARHVAQRRRGAALRSDPVHDRRPGRGAAADTVPHEPNARQDADRLEGGQHPADRGARAVSPLSAPPRARAPSRTSGHGP